MRTGSRVLIVRGDSDASPSADAAPTDSATQAGTGREWFAQQLAAVGASCDYVVAYRRCTPSFDSSQHDHMQRAAQDGTVWLFSSSEALHNLQRIGAVPSWALARAVATHPRIAQTAREMGFSRVLEARPVLTDLIASIESLA